jgi:citrate synthase
VSTADQPELQPRGLEGVVATSTAISKVEDGNLVYRGYAIEELAT